MNGNKYHVFMSFRGADTRFGFTRNLHRALHGKGIKSFMDDQDLEKGSEINPSLEEAIQNSRIAIVVLSKNYAASTFCLEELSKIMVCSKKKGTLVLPVFYGVEPSDIRHLKGTYGDALREHEAVRNIEKVQLEKWRLALQNVANLSGWHFNHDRYEYELIDNIVQDIFKKIRSLPDRDKNKIIYNVNDKYNAEHDRISDEPPPYTSLIRQRYESFENPLAGNKSQSFGSQEDERVSSGNQHFGTTLFDFSIELNNEIKEEPPSYSSSIKQRYGSFDNPLAGNECQSLGSQDDERVSSGNPQFRTALYDFTAGGDDELSLTAGEEVKIEYEVDG